jgi:molybdopterin biosynthesis enzyme
MGHEPTVAVGPGQTARIWTGGMMPAGADAVVMLEYAPRWTVPPWSCPGRLLLWKM